MQSRMHQALGSTAKTITTGTQLWNGSVAIDGSGRALAAWSQGFVVWTVPNQIRITTSSAQGAWSAPRTVSSGSGSFVAPVAAVDQLGNAIVAWQTYLGTSTASQIDAIKRGGYAGVFSKPFKVSGNEVNPLTPQAAAATDGSLFAITWSGGASVVTTNTIGGAFSTPTVLGRSQWNTPVAIAAGTGGHASALWNRPQPGRHNMDVAASTLD
jgi:hypothetical protein